MEKVTIVKANAFADIPGNTVAIACTCKNPFPEKMIHPLSDKVIRYECGLGLRDLSSSYLKNRLYLIPSNLVKLRRVMKDVILQFNPDIAISVGEWEMYPLATISLPRLLRHKAVKVREFHFNSFQKHYLNPSFLQRLIVKMDNYIVSRLYDRNYLLTREDKETNFPRDKRFDYQWNPCTFSTSGEPRAFNQRSNVIAMVCRFNPEKHIDAMLRIWSKVHVSLPGWELHIIGDGEQRQSLKDLSDRLGISDSIKFMGFRSDIPTQLSDCKLLASTSKFEGMPLNIIEAMMAGVVPISYRTPYGPSDIIEDGISGILVDYLDEDQFAHRLVDAIKNGNLPCMSQNAYRRAQLFQLDNIISQWMAKYNQLLS